MNDRQMGGIILDVIRAECSDMQQRMHDLEEFTEKLIAIWDKKNDLAGHTCELSFRHWDEDTATWGCVCSACGTHLEHDSGLGYNFCPICGALVKGRGEYVARIETGKTVC